MTKTNKRSAEHQADTAQVVKSNKNHSKASPKWLALALVIIVGGLGSYMLAASHADTVSYSHDPIGWVDSCVLSGTTTVISGWADDPDVPQGPNPTVTLHVGSQTKTVATNVAGYRDASINPYLRAHNSGRPTSGVYGFTASFSGMYRGGNYPVNGTIINVGPGTSTAIKVNATNNLLDGVAHNSLTNDAVPAACLPPKPTTVAGGGSTPVSTPPPVRTGPITQPLPSNPTGPSKVVPMSHNPYGFIDYCAYVDNKTVLYGWAADPDAPAGGLPSVSVTLQQYNLKPGVKSAASPATASKSYVLQNLVSSSASTDGANYRDEAINTWIKAHNASDPTPGTYGYRVAYSGLYKGSYYTATGTIANYGPGVNSALDLNVHHYTDGDRNRPYFVGGIIPSTCLAPLPSNSNNHQGTVVAVTPPAAQPVSSPAHSLPLFISNNGAFDWSAIRGARYDSGQFTVANGDYQLNLTGNNLVETFKNQTIWQDPATINYPNLPSAKQAQVLFTDRGQVSVVDPNVTGGNFAVWSSADLGDRDTNVTYSLQLSQCGGIYVYRKSGQELVGGRTVVADNSAHDKQCGTAQLGSNSRLSMGSSLYIGMSLVSPDGSHSLNMHPGVVTLTDRAGKTVWKASGKDAVRLVVGGSSELALLNQHGTIVWHSDTAGSGADYAAVQNNGYLVLWDSSPKKPVAVWENGVSAVSCTIKKLVATYPDDGGIVCAKTAASLSKVETVTMPDPSPCHSIGEGKYNCNFILPTPVETSKNQLTGKFIYASTNWIVCQQASTKQVSHGRDKNVWWGYTLSDDGGWGWVSAVYAKGGDNNGKFQGVPNCHHKHGATPTAIAHVSSSKPRSGSGSHGSRGSGSTSGSRSGSTRSSGGHHQTGHGGSPSTKPGTCSFGNHDSWFGECTDPKNHDCGNNGQWELYHRGQCGCVNGFKGAFCNVYNNSQGGNPCRNGQCRGESGGAASSTYLSTLQNCSSYVLNTGIGPACVGSFDACISYGGHYYKLHTSVVNKTWCRLDGHTFIGVDIAIDHGGHFN